MNELLLHIIPLSVMLLNCVSTNWVLWSGTIELEGFIPVDVEMSWGLYQIQISTDWLNKAELYMSIPNFVKFTSNEFGVQLLDADTLPVYYAVYVLYILCILFEVFVLCIGIRQYDKKLDHIMVKRNNLVCLSMTRTLISIFLLLVLFTHYGTNTVCLNSYFNNSSHDETRLLKTTANDEVCTYSWSSVTIVGTELLMLLHTLYIMCISFTKRRQRTSSDIDQQEYFELTIDNEIQGV